MKIKQVINQAKNALTGNNIEDASLISRVFLSHILGCKKEELLNRYDEELDDKQTKDYLMKIEKICNGYPLQYVIHNKEFMKMNFYVDENVLVPRSDTEILVEEVINIAEKYGKRDILELCTGSGVVAISLMKYLRNVKITATDISKEALSIAIKNEEMLLKNKKIEFIQSDIFEKIDKKYDIIVSNPPYIKTDIIKDYILKYEPKIALDGRKRWIKILQYYYKRRI